MNAFIEHHQQAIRFDYFCFDPILLNGVIQVLQNPACVVGFLKEERQANRVTPASFRAIKADYVMVPSAFETVLSRTQTDAPPFIGRGVGRSKGGVPLCQWHIQIFNG